LGMKWKNLTLIFDVFDFESLHLMKDVGMIPYYLNRLFGIDCKIVCFENEKNADFPEIVQNIHIIRLKNIPGILKRIPVIKKLRQLFFFFYIFKHAKEIDVFHLYLFSWHSIINGLFYRFLRPDGFIYVKLDDDLKNIRQHHYFLPKPERGLRKKFIEAIESYFIRKCSLFSIETREGLKYISEYLPEIREKIVYIPNGVDNLFLSEYFLGIKNYSEKENIIITVGRIGTKQKNSGVLLKALEKIDLKEWKACFIGPIEPDFQDKIKAFFIKNPHLRKRVLFTGNIDRITLYQWYDRAKVFCLPSLWESYGIVLAEAIYFGNYVITTNVGAAFDITDSGRLGRIIDKSDPEDCAEEFAGEIEAIISGRKDISIYYDKIIEHARKQILWENIVRNLYVEIKKRNK
jgi:glycosyltransferase involved in cell wall biosynthesis